VHQVERAADTRADLGVRLPAHLQRERDVVPHRHVGEQRVVLEDDADVAVLGRHARDRASVDRNLALGRSGESSHHHERGGLARSAGPEERDELAAPDVQIDRIDRRRARVALREAGESEPASADAVGHAQGCALTRRALSA
jgi:hypothetical protein